MNSVLRFETRSENETIEVGRRLAALLPRNRPVLLIGNLGAGKTTLAKGIAEGLKAAPADEVSSPTFTLIHEYGEPVRLYHADLYRLETQDQAGRLGLDELLEASAPLIVEWGERFPELFPSERVEIRIAETEPNRRVILVSGLGH
jgi:tRNA threonylcarbamoyladenosine biosynthesis protein TsaE